MDIPCLAHQSDSKKYLQKITFLKVALRLMEYDRRIEQRQVNNMKIARGFGKVIKPLVNFPAWMGWKQIKDGAVAIKAISKTLVPSSKASRRKETFEQAVARLRLSEADLQQRMKQFRMMALLYLAMGVGLFAYAIYLFINFSFMAGLLSSVLTALALALFFRQHFWYFQMKQRKLGCTVKEWFYGLFRRAR